MAMSKVRDDREQDKFQEVEGLTTVRVIPFGGLQIPSTANFIGVTYPTSTTEVYTYKEGGSLGTTLKVVTVTYLDDSKDQIISVEW